MHILKGVISITLYLLNFLICALIILIITPFVFLIPVKSWRIAFQRHIVQQIPECFSQINQWIMLISTRGRWDIKGSGELKKNGWYLLVSNHRSWLDILVLQNVFHGKIPTLKFFMKKELLWQLPLAGLACYVLGYPFMSRHSAAAVRKDPSLKGKDIESARVACERLRYFPTTLINFSEGTRYTQKKSERQQSPFRNLLKPHAGGAAVVIHELQDALSGVINVVIAYPNKMPSMWDFMCGRFDKVVVRYEVLPITPEMVGDYHQDRQFRSQMQQWFNVLWQRNDAVLDEILRT